MAPPPLIPAGVGLQLTGIFKTSKIRSQRLRKAAADRGNSLTPASSCPKWRSKNFTAGSVETRTCWILPIPRFLLFGFRIFRKATQTASSKESLGSTKSPRVAERISLILAIPSYPRSKEAAHLVHFHNMAIANMALNRLSGRGCLCLRGCATSHFETSCQHGAISARTFGNSCWTRTSKCLSS